jgi:large subunit ribosomal protein L10
VLKSEKVELIKELNDKFSRAQTAIVAEFRKVDVATVTDLRKKFRVANIEYKVLKNTLAKLAAKGTSLEAVSDDFVGPIAVALSYGDDVVAPAKILSDFLKDRENIKVKSAVIQGKKTDAAGVQALAKLPGIQELRARIAGVINQPATLLVRTLQAPSSQVARVLAARQEQLGQQG